MSDSRSAEYDWYRTHFDMSPVGMATVSARGRIIEANQTLATMLDYPLADLKRTSWDDLRDASGEYILHDLATRAHDMIDERIGLRRRDGSHLAVHLTAQGIHRQDGAFDHCLIQVHPLAADGEDDRHGSRPPLAGDVAALMLDSITDMVGLVDDHFRLIAYNRAGSVLFGLEREPQPDLRCFHLFGHDQPCAACPVREALATGTPCESERQVAGTNRWYRYRAVPLTDQRRVVIYLADISERKRGDEARERQRAFTEALLWAIPTPVFYKDAEGRYLGCNHAFEDFFGVKRSRLVGKTVFEVWCSEDARIYHEKDMQVLRSGGEQHYEYHQRDHNGELRDVLFSKTVFRDSDGAVAGLVGAFVDITDRKRLEEERHQAARLDTVGRLAGGVAHDFNNMLGGIIGMADLLLSALPDGGQEQHYARVILETSERAADLTAKLLAFSRKGRLLTRAVDVHRCIREAAELLHHGGDRRMDIRLALEAPGSVVAGDPGQLQSMILNLGLNARDAMPDGGSLTIGTRQVVADVVPGSPDFQPVGDGDFLAIEVADQGVGMSAEVRAKMFEPFFSTKGVGKGTGLGLSAVYGTVKDHGGSLEVCSDPGQGTTVRIYLPLRHGQTEDHAVTAPLPTRSRGRVLVVDDEAVIRITSEQLLARLGFEPLLASDGYEAVEVFSREHTNLQAVLLDVIMPGLDGAATLERLRAIDTTVPVVISSGYSKNAEIEEMLARGATGFIQKPYTKDRLWTGLSEALPPETIAGR